MDIQWEPFQLPNIPLYRTKLDDVTMDYLWSCVKQAEKDNVDSSNDYSHRLAGNISGSLGLKDKDNHSSLSTNPSHNNGKILKPIGQ